MLCGLAQSRDHVLSVQLLGHTPTHHVPIPDAGELMEMDAVGLLRGRSQPIGHVRR